MRTIIEAEIFPVCQSSGANKQLEFMTTTTRDISPRHSQSNSNQGEQDSVLSDYFFIPSSPSSIPVSLSSNTNSNDISDDNRDETDYLSEFVCPTDSDDESLYFNDDSNNDIFLENQLSKAKLKFVNNLQDNGYQRSKRSKKKQNAQRQIKTKHAKSIKIKSHNKHLYIHHRLAKKVQLDEPRLHCIPSSEPVPLYSSDALRSIVNQHRYSYRYYSTSSRKNRYLTTDDDSYIDESQLNLTAYQYRDYTLHQFNIPDEPSYDDTMVNFLLEMQNRDLSPEDYEMLLRLDERVQRKTINTNILDTLPTIDADQTYLDEKCTICIENYNLGQKLKRLPCTHIFHMHCIETYLKEFSNQCPLDNLPLT